MFAYIVRRLLVSIPILLVASLIVFFLVAYSGDPLEGLKHRNPPTPIQSIRAEEHRLYLDKPPWERYLMWLKGLLLHGDFGPSNAATTNIGHQIGQRVFVTLRLVALAMVIAVIFAIIVGVYSAVRQYSVADYTFTFTGFLFLALPVFWFAILLKQAGIWANENLFHKTVFYTIGDRSVILIGKSAAVDTLEHMILPTIVLAMTSYAGWSRFQRASTLEVLNSDYVRLARAKGLSNRRVMVRHALRTALIPLTTVTALDLGGIIGGAVITEKIFQWHGMGDFFFQSVLNRDAFAILAWLIVSAFAVIVFNLLADLLYAVLDPRIRYE